MAHLVRFEIPRRDLGKADVDFHIWSNGARVGLLRVSKGAVVWYSKNARRGRRISWLKFSELMEGHGRKRERRKTRRRP
jgi:hypothetical protein